MAGQVFRLPNLEFSDSDDDESPENPRAAKAGIRMYIVPPRPFKVDEHTCNRSDAIYSAMEFIHLYCEIKAKKNRIMHLFPLEVEFPVGGLDSKLEWCIFCLGSRLCARIYGGIEDPDGGIGGYLPYMSNVLHLDQETLLMLVKFFREWFYSIGMDESLGAWLYAVLACIRMPLTNGVGAPIAAFYQDCEERLKFSTDPLERIRLYQFSAIFDIHFIRYMS